MKTEALKINLMQRVLSISDQRLLHKIQAILDAEDCFAYDADGHPVTNEDYVKELDFLNKEIDNGTADFYSTADVLKHIADDHKLAL